MKGLSERRRERSGIIAGTRLLLCKPAEHHGVAMRQAATTSLSAGRDLPLLTVSVWPFAEGKYFGPSRAIMFPHGRGARHDLESLVTPLHRPAGADTPFAEAGTQPGRRAAVPISRSSGLGRPWPGDRGSGNTRCHQEIGSVRPHGIRHGPCAGIGRPHDQDFEGQRGVGRHRRQLEALPGNASAADRDEAVPCRPSLSISSVAPVGEIGFDYVADFSRDCGDFGQPYTANNTGFKSAFLHFPIDHSGATPLITEARLGDAVMTMAARRALWRRCSA